MAAAAGRAHSHYPNHPVVLMVPYGPGGVADVGMRILGDKLSSRLHQQFVIENRPGAGRHRRRPGRRRRPPPTATRY